MEPAAMICGTADHWSGKHRSESTRRSAATSISTNEPTTAAAQECLRPLLLPQRATDRTTTVKIAIATYKPKDRSRPAKPTANRSAINCRICDGHRLPIYRGSQDEPNPAQTQQQMRAMGPTRKNQQYYHRGSAGGIP
jgi:hypothetical protein